MAMSGSDLEDEYPGRMLQQAAIYNNTEFMMSLLQGPERDYVDAQDPFGRTALYTSVTNNSLECAHMLLQAGADANISCGTQCGCMTPLHAAALDNKPKFVEMLVEHGADIEQVDASGELALHLAEKNRSTDCIDFLRARMENSQRARVQLEQEFCQACIDGDVEKSKSFLHRISERDVCRVVNTVREGQSSLLFKSCEKGHTAMVEFLLSHSATVHVHPVTGLSPLHVACQLGHAQCAELILQNFPELIRSPTIDGTVPLHLACTHAHRGVVTTLLGFPYPDRVKKLYKEVNGDRMYRLGVTVNAKDGMGSTALHLAVNCGKVEIVQDLLDYRVPVLLRYNEGNIEEVNPTVEATEDIRSRKDVIEDFCPVQVDVIDLDGNSPLHLAIKIGIGRQREGLAIAQVLLQHGANVNKPLVSSSGNTTPLMEACQREDVDMVELLLNQGAKDDNLQVLSTVVKTQNWDMIGAVLQFRSHLDSEHKVNLMALLQHYYGEDATGRMETSGTLRSLWPNTAMAVNWHGLGLGSVQMDWLMKACWQQVGRPNTDTETKLTLCCITRIDVSSNKLESLPEELFQLQSLRVLNASANRIVSLGAVQPARSCQHCGGSRADPDSMDNIPQIVMDSPPSNTAGTDVPFPEAHWDCPVLEEIDLQQNKLRTLPSTIFKLSALKRLSVAQNDLDTLPYSIWSSRGLTELNLSQNKLSSLPCNASKSGLVLPTDQSDTASVNSLTLDSPYGSLPSTPRRLAAPDAEDMTGASPIMPSSSSLALSPGDVDLSLEPHSASPEPSYMEIPITYVNHWKSRLRVKVGYSHGDNDSESDAPSKLKELNLSHNRFESVPVGLACLAPHLNRLNLSHNCLAQVGPLENYPANLKWLDLSHNIIISDASIESFASDTEAGLAGWTMKTCYDPNIQAKQHKRMSKMSRTGSTASLPSSSASATATSQVCCPHRLHQQLEKLKTLRLCNNKLTRLTLALDGDEDKQSSYEESLKSQSSTSSAGRRDSRLSATPSECPTEVYKDMLYPALSTLDISHNSLTVLPPDVSGMTQLAELKVAHNKLKELPPELGLVRKLWNLDFSGCPVEKTLVGLLGDKAKRSTAVLGYLKSVKEEATLYNRMKLMFVGIQGIGKTSLLNQLRKEGRSSQPKSKNWAQRMGHGSSKDTDLRGENISTVGVDIGDLILQRGNKEVIFKTWDFGGQKEYYATHQYFLSKRSLYLVVWRTIDGEQGVNEILQWLVNIQARAPNSPVIIVGTHLDMITKKKYPAGYVTDLQQLIFIKYMQHTEPEKSGLPRVMGCINVSCKARMLFNTPISDLVNLIWNVVMDEQLPGSKGARLLEQKVPSSYVHLQDVVCVLAEERKKDGKDPVLHAEQYKPLVIHKMEEMYNTSFRDVSELNQATQFLHENGVLLHYDDVSLQDIYFLDPQWLCDMLASVVTIREINSLAKSGIMRTDDLRVLFKNAAFKPEDIKTYIINLLSKFEVALMWDENNLLIPSMLPHESQLHVPGAADIRIPARGFRGKRGHSKSNQVIYSRVAPVATNILDDGAPTFCITAKTPDREVDISKSFTEQSQKPSHLSDIAAGRSLHNAPHITRRINPAVSIVRLYLMSYFPSGFWPRLITRLLGDESFPTMTMDVYDREKVPAASAQALNPEWRCWQSGVELLYLDVTVLRIREVPKEGRDYFCDYRQCNLVIKQDQYPDWATLNISSTSILEIILPNETLNIAAESAPHNIIQPSSQAVASLLAKIVDHVDTLLEDWYPDLGVRFVQNARGMYLITRIVPCTRCLLQQIELQEQRLQAGDAWSIVEVNPVDKNPTVSQPVVIPANSPAGTNGDAFTRSGEEGRYQQRPLSESAPVGDSSAWMESIRDKGMKVVGNVEQLYQKTAEITGVLPPMEVSLRRRKGRSITGPSAKHTIYCYLMEQCLQAAQMNKIVYCPQHGNLGPYFMASSQGYTLAAHVAPDSVFQDIGDKYMVDHDFITMGKFLGKGSFGAVYAGTMVHKVSGVKVPIAMKLLQPVKPGSEATPTQLHLYKVETQRWKEDPAKKACEAYLNARKELSILLALHHDNIVPLLGISLHPLCLILSLAPLGALGEQLSEFQRAGARLPVYVVWNIIVQVASALEYLHSCQIIYRDLKAENVLVWALPEPHSPDCTHPVHIKLADYGVSRSVLPSGARGFAGTPPFIAPEIIQHNGEETYTEKVDIFSFGMFIYELLLLKVPFEGVETAVAGGANLKSHVLAGGRPPITNKELGYPTHFLDLMTLCWSHDPAERPSANQIVKMARSTAFSNLHTVMPLDEGVEVLCGCSTPNWQYTFGLSGSYDDLPGLDGALDSFTDVWLATKSSDTMEGALMTFTYQGHECIHAKNIPLGPTVIKCLCIADSWVWCADTAAVVHIFSLKTYREMLKFPATTRPNVQIRCMAYGEPEQQMYIVLNNGRMILCESNFPQDFSVNYSPVKTECPGNGKSIHCLGILQTVNGSSELWCGQSEGRLSVWDLHSTKGSLRRVNHFEGERPSHDVVFAVTCPTDYRAVWTYVYPGSLVYRWDATTKSKTSHVDMASLISEEDRASIMPFLEQGKLKASKSQVTALTVHKEELYVATTWGCVAILDKDTMIPVSVLRCHRDNTPYINTILPLVHSDLPLTKQLPGCLLPDPGLVKCQDAGKSYIVTVGKDYRDLIGRVLPGESSGVASRSQMFVLCWSADNWRVTGRLGS